MNLPLRFAFGSFSFFLLATLSGCGADSNGDRGGNESTPPTTSPSPSGNGGDAARAISEADIIQVDGGRLYAMSKSGTVSVVDISAPGSLMLLGQTRIAGEPFEMYRRGDQLVAMTNRAVAPDGTQYQPESLLRATAPTTTAATIANGAGAAVIVLDVSEPTNIRTLSISPVPGEMADSRIVGNVLYTATYENARCYKCASKPRTVVTSFDVTRPGDLRLVDQAFFVSNAPEVWNAAWGSSWKRSIFVTTERFYIGGHADIEPSTLSQTTTSPEGIIDVLDITDPSGKLGPGAHLTVAGALLSRWQIDERDGILRVVSQKGAGRTSNGIGFPEVSTFTVGSSQQFVPLGKTQLKLPRQEGLRTVRFDADRAYAITYNQTDPLFVIDLRDPANPITRGELHMPGFMFHLEPYGDRLIGLGIDRTDKIGSLNVSLFDVSNMDDPRMLDRASFGVTGFGEDYAILNFEVAEDQDRIQKAFRILDGGLVVVPHSVPQAPGYSGTGSCANGGRGAVQLVQWTGNSLVRQASLPTKGNARRAFLNQGEILAVSDSNVTSFDAASRTSARQTADVVIGECVARTLPNSTPGMPGGYDGSSGSNSRDRYGRYTCTTAGAIGHTSGSTLAFGALGAMITLGALARRRQRR